MMSARLTTPGSESAPGSCLWFVTGTRLRLCVRRERIRITATLYDSLRLVLGTIHLAHWRTSQTAFGNDGKFVGWILQTLCAAMNQVPPAMSQYRRDVFVSTDCRTMPGKLAALRALGARTPWCYPFSYSQYDVNRA